VYCRFGEPAEVLSVQAVPKPVPAAGLVRVRVQARAINPSDLLTIRGTYTHRTALPAVAGFEGVGVVDAIGETVTTLRPGDRVLPLGGQGTWQEYTLVPESRCVPVPAAVDDDSACQLYVNPMTAWLMLVEELRLKPGDTLAVNAGGSALCRVAAQLARLRGVRLFAIVRRAGYDALLTGLGAEAVIDTTREPLQPALLRLTDGTGVTAALDAVGGEAGAELARCLVPGGVMLHYGLLSGQRLALSSAEIEERGIRVRGYWLRQWAYSTPPEQRQAVFAAVIDLIAAGRLKLEVAARYDLAAVTTAVRAAERRSGHRGKIILVG